MAAGSFTSGLLSGIRAIDDRRNSAAQRAAMEARTQNENRRMAMAEEQHQGNQADRITRNEQVLEDRTQQAQTRAQDQLAVIYQGTRGPRGERLPQSEWAPGTADAISSWMLKNSDLLQSPSGGVRNFVGTEPSPNGVVPIVERIGENGEVLGTGPMTLEGGSGRGETIVEINEESVEQLFNLDWVDSILASHPSTQLLRRQQAALEYRIGATNNLNRDRGLGSGAGASSTAPVAPSTTPVAPSTAAQSPVVNPVAQNPAPVVQDPAVSSLAQGSVPSPVDASGRPVFQPSTMPTPSAAIARDELMTPDSAAPEVPYVAPRPSLPDGAIQPSNIQGPQVGAWRSAPGAAPPARGLSAGNAPAPVARATRASVSRDGTPRTPIGSGIARVPGMFDNVQQEYRDALRGNTPATPTPAASTPAAVNTPPAAVNTPPAAVNTPPATQQETEVATRAVQAAQNSDMTADQAASTISNVRPGARITEGDRDVLAYGVAAGWWSMEQAAHYIASDGERWTAKVRDQFIAGAGGALWQIPADGGSPVHHANPNSQQGPDTVEQTRQIRYLRAVRPDIEDRDFPAFMDAIEISSNSTGIDLMSRPGQVMLNQAEGIQRRLDANQNGVVNGIMRLVNGEQRVEFRSLTAGLVIAASGMQDEQVGLQRYVTPFVRNGMNDAQLAVAGFSTIGLEQRGVPYNDAVALVQQMLSHPDPRVAQRMRNDPNFLNDIAAEHQRLGASGGQ